VPTPRRLAVTVPPDTTKPSIVNTKTVAGTDPPAYTDAAATTGVTYYYVAWNQVAGKTSVGSYVGNGVDNRSISGVGFQPRFVIVQSANDGYDPFQRSVSMVGDASVSFRNALTTNRIQALEADGFQVGTYTAVNKSPGACIGETDCDYIYVAFGR